ncbi:hypothetical protein PV325_002124 [Microctonus aethiopoides]|nr:hypothetical protein PV325_002124 [Microctonus aethiopoides]
MTQFNGLHGCTYCLQPGETFHFPQASESGHPVMGVKGPCYLSRLMPNFIFGTGIDRMHCVDGRVIKKLLTLWFNVKYRDCPFSLIHFKRVIDRRLRSIKPPMFVHRFPRSVDDLLHWKASELRI